MDRIYYYLGTDRSNPQGPYTLPELSSMMMHGELFPTTEVAAKGDSAWRPLAVLLMEKREVVPTEEPLPGGALPGGTAMPPIPDACMVDVGECPSCHSKIECDGRELPVCCPHCQYLFRPKQDGWWSHALFALRRYAVVRGRSTRKEFWSFSVLASLGYAFFAILLMVGLGALLDALGRDEDASGPLFFLSVAGGLYVLYALFLLVPSLCVLVRRLHDMGRSGLWVLWTIALNAISQSYSFYCLYLLYEEVRESLWGMLYAETFAQQEMYLSQFDQQITAWAASTPNIIISFVCLAGSILSLIVFVMLFFDSTRGANRYGPSSKYPLR